MESRMIWRYDWSSQLCTQFKQLCNRSLKNSGLNGIRTHDLCDAGAVLYQLSHEAIWELASMCLTKVMGLNPIEAWILLGFYFTTA